MSGDNSTLQQFIAENVDVVNTRFIDWVSHYTV